MDCADSMNLLAISGSLRAASFNTMLLNALSELTPRGVVIKVYSGIGHLPLFNPDLVKESIASVMDFKCALDNCRGVIIASPEYAHGVTGVMKNALDWVVDCETFVNKPVALLNASPRATHAHAALRETLSVMSAYLVDSASVTVPILGSKLDKDGIVQHPQISDTLKKALVGFTTAIVRHETESAE